MLMMKNLKDLEFEPVHPKNVLLASVVHGISCLLANRYSKRCTAVRISEYLFILSNCEKNGQIIIKLDIREF
jgi:hypothetical protein